MNKKISSFFDLRGNTKYTPEFKDEEQINIKLTLDSIINPQFDEFVEDINSRKDLNAVVIKPSNKIDNLIETIELHIREQNQLKLVYRFKFIKENDLVLFVGQFQIPDIYGEANNIKETNLKIPIQQLTQNIINNDISSTIVENFDKR